MVASSLAWDEVENTKSNLDRFQSEGPGALSRLVALFIGRGTRLTDRASAGTRCNEQDRRNGHHTKVCHRAEAYTRLPVACNA